MKTLIAQGAEAKLFREGEILVKERIPKGYRLKELDAKIRIQRTRKEAKILEKAGKLILVPKIFGVDEVKGSIKMEFLEGKKLAECLDDLPEKKRLEICKTLGEQLASLHNEGIIHGDLTTSNMILSKEKVYFIDFGLSFIHTHPEHKAVDLHVLKQAFESKHWQCVESCFEAFILGYKEQARDAEAILKRFEVVELRGRYKRKGS